jgi:hypothetical protein
MATVYDVLWVLITPDTHRTFLRRRSGGAESVQHVPLPVGTSARLVMFNGLVLAEREGFEPSIQVLARITV